MHYLDSSRPKVAYKPAFITAEGAGVVPLSMPVVNYSVHWYLTLWLPCRESSTYSAHNVRFGIDHLPSVLTEYIQDPEAWIWKNIGYSFFLPVFGSGEGKEGVETQGQQDAKAFLKALIGATNRQSGKKGAVSVDSL